MTKKEIIEFLANTKVYVNGKSKEIQEKLFSLGYKWLSIDTDVDYTEEPFLFICSNMFFYKGNNMEFFSLHELREITAEQILSLELTEPKYRPFENQEECWNEMMKHEPFGWVIVRASYEYRSITTIGKEQNYALMFDTYTFADGTPFGIKED